MATVTYISILSEVRSCYTKLKFEEKYLLHLDFEPRDGLSFKFHTTWQKTFFEKRTPNFLQNLIHLKNQGAQHMLIDLSLYGRSEGLTYYN